MVTINASDLAAAGATPNSFLAALDLPRDWPLAKLERLLQGIQASCAANGLAYVGGNIREGLALSATGTAVGSSSIRPLTRTGAAFDSHLVVIGKHGRFWSHVFALRQNESLPDDSPLFKPVSQVNAMQQLRDVGVVQCAMDTSDGLAPTLHELARVNQMTIEIDLAELRSCCSERGIHIASERAWMGWGDWSVVISVGNKEFLRFMEFVEDNQIDASKIGRFRQGKANVQLFDRGRSIPLGRLESERFASDSWFHKGISFYEEMLNTLELP